MAENPTLACLAREFADRLGLPRLEAAEVCAAAKERGLLVKDGRVYIEGPADKNDLYFELAKSREII